MSWRAPRSAVLALTLATGCAGGSYLPIPLPLPPGSAPAPAGGAGELDAGATRAEIEAARREVLIESNAARRRSGLGLLERDAELDRSAQRHAEDMLARGYFAHDNPEGLDARGRAVAAGYEPRAIRIGENLGQGHRTAGHVVERWLASPAHRHILLDGRYTESGVGVAAGTRDGRTKIYWVQVFALPRGAG